jgi:serine/threonine protein kinase
MKSKDIQGTKSYIAPEVLLRQAITPQTDMYSLGVTLYLALTGEYPITGLSPTDLLKNHLRVTPPNPSQLNPNVTPEMDQFVMTMLAKAPAKRFKTMDEAYSIARNLKIWKEDPETVEARRKEKDDQLLRDGVDAARRLDSRSDAARTVLLGQGASASAPTRPVAKPKPRPQPQPQKQPAAPQPMPQPPAYAPQPGYAPMPGGYYPGTMPPQYYPPMQPQPYGMPPGYAPPPGYGQMPPQQPAAAAPAPPSQPQPAPPSAPPKPAPAQKPPEPDLDELPLMEELPPVL